MIPIMQNIPAIPELEDIQVKFESHVAKSKKALKELLENLALQPENKPKFKSNVYGGFKEFLLITHRYKCAYCERDIHNQFGDVEHYRPKGRVISFETNAVEEHPGYYWKAYDWDNFLLSCTRCNSAFKKNYFPVDGQRSSGPDTELDEEIPLIVNPITDNPNDHFQLQANGKLLGITKAGRITILIMGLNDEYFITRRSRALKKGKRTFDALMAERDPDEIENLRQELREMYCERSDEFSMASVMGILGAHMFRSRVLNQNIDLDKMLKA